MMEMEDGIFECSEETFKYNIKKFKMSGKKNYDFLTKSGPKFQKAVFKMCQRMFLEESFPSEFQNTTLHMIFKGGKGKQNVLENNRFVHCKEWLPRVAESLVVEDGLKDPLIQGSSIYQIGGQPGHRSEELLFVLKTVVARSREQGRMIILQSYDIY